MATQIIRRYVHADVEDEINTQLDLGRTPKQVEMALARNADFKGRVPALRTLQRMAREHAPAVGDPWTIGESSGPDGITILAALQEVIVHSRGAKMELTKGEANDVARLAHIAPEIPPLAHFLLSKSERQRDVQVFLAFHPWRSQGDLFTYVPIASRAGLRVPLVPPYPTLVLNSPESFWEYVALMRRELENWPKQGDSNEPKG